MFGDNSNNDIESIYYIYRVLFTLLRSQIDVVLDIQEEVSRIGETLETQEDSEDLNNIPRDFVHDNIGVFDLDSHSGSGSNLDDLGSQSSQNSSILNIETDFEVLDIDSKNKLVFKQIINIYKYSEFFRKMPSIA